MRRRAGRQWGRAGCVSCGEGLRVTAGKWTTTVCRTCAAASWVLIYDRSTGVGTIPDNLRRAYELGRTAA
jgi:hypothetical protein